MVEERYTKETRARLANQHAAEDLRRRSPPLENAVIGLLESCYLFFPALSLAYESSFKRLS